MWLASVSYWPGGQPLLTGDYTPFLRKRAYRLLRQYLAGVGDERWGRFFRMNLTFCLHRGLSDAEIATLPKSWEENPPVHLAGGPIEVFWSKGVAPGVLSCNPCENPTRHYVTPTIWLPYDCGECPPCRARAEIERTGQPCAACEIGEEVS